jgi:prepilin-type N-terminal cleavage/methylation domain-containing protein
MNKAKSGFTILELLVVITIIGILTTITIISYSVIQANSRDSQRSSKVTVIAEALEKYYDKNGEYPSCAAMSAQPTTVLSNTLPGIDPTALTFPKTTSGTNSILPNCNDLNSNSGDVIAYIGDGSSTCQTQDCLQWTIKYKQEGSGRTITVNSRRRTNIATSGNINNLSATTAGFTQINLSWVVIPNITDYTIQQASNNAFTVNLTQTTSSSNTLSMTGLSFGTLYYYRVRPDFASGSGNWSNISNATTLSLLAPVATSTTNSTSQITTSWPVVANATSYTINRSLSSSFTSPTTITGITATNYVSTGLAASTTYYFRVTAVSGSNNSPYSNITNVATAHLTTPVASATTNSSYQITASWNAVSYATSYTINRSLSSSFTSPTTVTGVTATSYAFTGLTPATVYYFRVTALNANDTSSVSGTVTATTTIDAPAAPSISAYQSGGWAYGQAGAVSCNGGTPYYQVVYNINDSGQTWPGWTGSLVGTGNNQGYKYGYWAYAYCQGPSAASAASGGNYASTIIPINTPGAPDNIGYIDSYYFGDSYAYSSAQLAAYVTILGTMHYYPYTYRIAYQSTGCPSGTTVNGSFRSQSWSGNNYGPHPWPTGFSDNWASPGVAHTVSYWGKYQCVTSYYQSGYSAEHYSSLSIN